MKLNELVTARNNCVCLYDLAVYSIEGTFLGFADDDKLKGMQDADVYKISPASNSMLTITLTSSVNE